MEFRVLHGAVAEVAADVLVVPFDPSGRPGPGADEALELLGLELEQALSVTAGETTPGSVIRLPAATAGKLGGVALVAVELDRIDNVALRNAAAAAGRACRNAPRLATTLHRLGEESHDAIAAVADGFAWGGYRFTAYAGGDTSPREVLLLCERDDAELPAGLKNGVRVAAADIVRTMVSMPANDATPAALAAETARLAERAGISCRIWSTDELAAGGFGAIVAVGGGSANEPRMVELRYEGGAGPRIALIGKGITFDSGGLDLKDLRRMVEMKNDMAGGATVIAATWAAAELGLGVNLVTVVPFAESMPSGTALRPSDVIRHFDGTTTEVISPDSEGRLVLADALAYVRGGDFDAVVDVATLTGSTSLGIELWGLLGNDRELLDALLAAGRRAGDPGWELPLWRSYRRFMRSDIADRSNDDDSGPYSAGAIMGALFLEEFVAGERWAHLDIDACADWRGVARPTWAPQGPTGSPTSVLIHWLESIAGRPHAP
jgi:leucyl aminopeptidase